MIFFLSKSPFLCGTKRSDKVVRVRLVQDCCKCNDLQSILSHHGHIGNTKLTFSFDQVLGGAHNAA